MNVCFYLNIQWIQRDNIVILSDLKSFFIDDKIKFDF